MIPIRKPTEQHQSSDGSGYLAAHVLYLLLSRGHSVVTTVRSPKKAQMIQKAHRNLPKSKLNLAFVEDITNPDAFSQAVITEPPSEAVTHRASPFHCNIPNTKKDLIDPAPNSATGILYIIRKHPPTVRRVVITSSSAATINAKYGNGAGKISSEADFNPISEAEATLKSDFGFRASKTFTEKAAWDFVEQEKPNFTLSVCNPP